MEHSKDPKAERLLQLCEDVSRIAGSLAQLSIGPGAPSTEGPPITNSNEPAILLKSVTWLIRARRDRACYLPQDLFAEPAWDILLELFRGFLANEQVPVSSACMAAGVPASTGQRWLRILENQAMVLRSGDPRNAGKAFVVLAPATRDSLRRYFLDIVDADRDQGS
jgi:hypothetical protein